MRLIDVDKLIEIFNYDLACFETSEKQETKMYVSVADMRKMISEQPTAYDVDKVVEQLEKKMNHSFNQRYKAFAEAIEIVRNGGAK